MSVTIIGVSSSLTVPSKSPGHIPTLDKVCATASLDDFTGHRKADGKCCMIGTGTDRDGSRREKPERARYATGGLRVGNRSGND